MDKKKNPPDWLPDWKKKSNYPNPEETQARQWAWEFLRRNPEYQRECAEYLELQGETLRDEAIARGRRYGLNVLIPPDNPSPFNPPGPLHNFIDGLPVRAHFHYAGPAQERDNNLIELRLKPRQCLIVFNVGKDIGLLLEEARYYLEYLQQGVRPKVRRTKTSYNKYRDYLRFLDAEAQGVEIKVIADVLFYDKDSLTRKVAYQRVWTGLKKAKQLRDSDYRNIPYCSFPFLSSK